MLTVPFALPDPALPHQSNGEATAAFPLVTLRNVSLVLEGRPVLQHINWCIPAGTHWCITGPNGAGKSTLLQIVRGERRPSSQAITSPVDQYIQPEGEIERSREEPAVIWHLGAAPETTPLAVKKRIAAVTAEMQEIYLRQQWRLTGEECLLSGFDGGSMLYRPSTPQEQEKARNLAEHMGIASLLETELPAMSQGQLRLILMARALIAAPALLILDEVCEGLAPPARDALLSAADSAANAGVTLLFVSHRPDEIPATITHQLDLNKGCVTYCGPLGSSTPASSSAISRFVQHEATYPQKNDNTAYSPAPSPAVYDHPPYTPLPLAKKTPLFHADNADVFIARQRILKAVNWTVQQGESWSVSGPNGAGKSTLLRLLYADERQAWGGTAEWFGEHTPHRLHLHARLGIVSDKQQATYGFDRYHSAQSAVTAEELVWSGFTHSEGIWDWQHISREQKTTATHWIRWFGLQEYTTHPIRSLSYGLLRRFLICRAVVHSPNLLLLDEVCSGLDIMSREHVLSTLQSLIRAGMQLVYVTHREEEILPEITQELILSKGTVQSAGPRNNR